MFGLEASDIHRVVRVRPGETDRVEQQAGEAGRKVQAVTEVADDVDSVAVADAAGDHAVAVLRRRQQPVHPDFLDIVEFSDHRAVARDDDLSAAAQSCTGVRRQEGRPGVDVERFSAGDTRQGIGVDAGSAVDHVPAISRAGLEDPVIAAIAEDRIIALTADEDVAAAIPAERVIAAHRKDRLRAVSTADVVSGVRTEDDRIVDGCRGCSGSEAEDFDIANDVDATHANCPHRARSLDRDIAHSGSCSDVAEVIDRHAPERGVSANLSIHDIVALPAGQDVVSIATQYDVIARPTPKGVSECRPSKGVIRGRRREGCGNRTCREVHANPVSCDRVDDLHSAQIVGDRHSRAEELVVQRRERRACSVRKRERCARLTSNVRPGDPIGGALPLDRERCDAVGIQDRGCINGQDLPFRRRRIADDRSSGRRSGDELGDVERPETTEAVTEFHQFDVPERVRSIGNPGREARRQNRRVADHVMGYDIGAIFVPLDRVVLYHIPEHSRIDVANLAAVQDFPDDVHLARRDDAVGQELRERLANPGRIASVLSREDVRQAVDRSDLVFGSVLGARCGDADADVQPAVAIEDVVAALADQHVVTSAADQHVTSEDLLSHSVRLQIAELRGVDAIEGLTVRDDLVETIDPGDARLVDLVAEEDRFSRRGDVRLSRRAVDTVVADEKVVAGEA